MLRKVRKGLGSRNSRRVRMKASLRRHSRPNHSRTRERPEFWRSRISSRASHRTSSLRVSELMRGTVPPMMWVGHRPCPYWRPTRRDPAVVLTSVRSTAALEAVAEEVVAVEVEPEALAAVVPEAAFRYPVQPAQSPRQGGASDR